MVHGGSRRQINHSDGTRMDSSSDRSHFECGPKRKMMSPVELPTEPADREIIGKKAKAPYIVHIISPNNPATSPVCTCSPAHPSYKHPVENNLRPLSGPSHTNMPTSNMLIPIDSPVSSEDNTPLSELMHKKKKSEEAKSIVPSSNVTCLDSLPPHLLTIWKIIESEYVPKESYHKIEKKYRELTSELTFTKSRVKELENKLEISEAKRAKSEKLTYLAKEAAKTLEKSVEKLKADTNMICEKFIKDASVLK